MNPAAPVTSTGNNVLQAHDQASHQRRLATFRWCYSRKPGSRPLPTKSIEHDVVRKPLHTFRHRALARQLASRIASAACRSTETSWLTPCRSAPELRDKLQTSSASVA